MTMAAITALIVAITGLVAALAALYKQWQAGRQVQAHVQAHASEVHPPADPAAKP